MAKLLVSPEIKKAARAVGALMRTNPDAPRTPCHRVVSADGSLTGYSAKGGIKKKKQMLIEEGVIFKNDKVDKICFCATMLWAYFKQ
jgi:O-6-methylguanine DNA methyltransferase